MYLDPQKLETCAFALAEAHFAKTFEQDPKSSNVQRQANSTWQIFLPAAIIVVTTWEHMRSDNDA